MPGQLIHPHVRVAYKTFDASRVPSGEYIDSKYSSGQKVAYIKYNHCNLQLQSPKIHVLLLVFQERISNITDQIVTDAT